MRRSTRGKKQQMEKRFKADDNDVQQSIPTKNNYVQQSVPAKGDTNILDVNEDCLVEIFMHLSASDLLHVNDSHPHFKVAIERTVKQKFRYFPIVVSNSSNLFQTSLRILEQFGKLFDNIGIEFDFQSKTTGCFVGAIDLHCRRKESSMDMNHDQRIESFFRGLNSNYPNLHHLHYMYLRRISESPHIHDIIQSFPSLKSFSVTGDVFSDEIDDFMNLNSQLESLALNVDVLSRSFIYELNVKLPQLKHLKINLRYAYEWMDAYPREPRFMNLRKLTFDSLSLRNYKLLSFFGDQIEELDLHTEAFTVHFIEQISKFKKLRRLTLRIMPHVSWNPNVLLELILRKNLLTEIKVYTSERQENWEDKYQFIIKQELNGGRWDGVKCGKCLIFFKSVK